MQINFQYILTFTFESLVVMAPLSYQAIGFALLDDTPGDCV